MSISFAERDSIFHHLMLEQLKQQIKNDSVAIDDKILSYHEELTSFKILEDPKFQKKSEPSQSISDLHGDIQLLETSLTNLNDLWIIKALINEITVYLHETVDINELELLVDNFSKLSQRLNQLNSGILIKFELGKKFDDLTDQLAIIIDSVFHKFMPSATKFNSDIQGGKFSEFLKLVESFSTITEKVDINHLIQPYRKVWESSILKINSNMFLKLQDGEISFTDGNKSQFESIKNFVEYINLIDIPIIKQFLQLKLSNTLISLISENINDLYDSNHTLIEIMDILDRSDWNLSINLNSNNINEKLNEIHNDWIMDTFINRVREKFSTIDLKDLSEVKVDKPDRYNDIEDKIDTIEKKMQSSWSMEEENKQEEDEKEEGWNDEWQDDWDEPQSPVKQKQEVVEEQRKEEEEEDQWDDGWQEDWDQDSPVQSPVKSSVQSAVKTKPETVDIEKSPTSPTDSTSMKVTKLPLQLVEIVNDFYGESSSDESLLISTILSLSTVTYPSINESFLQYNDLQYLYKNLPMEKLDKFSNNLIKTLQNNVSNELIQLLVNHSLEYDQDKLLPEIVLWFDNKINLDLKHTNTIKFIDIILYAMDFINNWITNSIFSMEDIGEETGARLMALISNIEQAFIVIIEVKLSSLGVEMPPSFHKLDNVKFIINNHLVEIIERFYQGEFYDLSTNELVTCLKQCFIKSDLRDNYINEIVEFRSVN